MKISPVLLSVLECSIRLDLAVAQWMIYLLLAIPILVYETLRGDKK